MAPQISLRSKLTSSLSWFPNSTVTKQEQRGANVMKAFAFHNSYPLCYGPLLPDLAAQARRPIEANEYEAYPN